jgi:hypothetical protein
MLVTDDGGLTHRRRRGPDRRILCWLTAERAGRSSKLRGGGLGLVAESETTGLLGEGGGRQKTGACSAYPFISHRDIPRRSRLFFSSVLYCPSMDIKAAVEEFTQRLHAIIEGHAMERARDAVMGALGVSPKRGPGRPPKAKKVALTAITSTPMKHRKKGPLQLCPVPGCKNPAAPVFGMVCAKHKDVAKSKIKKYRDARKAKKLQAAA